MLIAGAALVMNGSNTNNLNAVVVKNESKANTSKNQELPSTHSNEKIKVCI